MTEKDYLNPEELYLFNRGELFHSYLKFGAHKGSLNDIWGVHFTVWAPHAISVSVVGDFNHWHGSHHKMECLGSTGVWHIFIPYLDNGVVYKYEIETLTGVLLKADPFAFFAEVRSQTASIVYSVEGYEWNDGLWHQEQERLSVQSRSMLIYEVHLGSWKRKEDNAFYSFRDLAEELVPYVRDMGYTHIELLPIMEHPYDGSWGYQVTGYYSVTSRYGTPHDLMYLIDKCHQAGIGIILDWVPGHFCKDAHGLGRFDGTPIYESDEHQQWGTYKFDFSRTEVWSFLISNALFWFDIFHIDGLRVDGVTSMLFLDYGRESSSWTPNIRGGRENLEAISFLQKLNEVVLTNYPKALMIAEEATDWPLVTKPPYDGGLGFNYKWNMGWMNDTLKYMEIPFELRKNHHHLLTFSLVYAFAEGFILPLSHDEVVHGKKSLVGKMAGDYWQKFAGLRALYLYQLCHPGKKLIFMGGEFAQFIEWNEDCSLEWFLLEHEKHRKYLGFVKIINQLYLQERSLWQNDNDWQGFEWIEADNCSQSILIFLRRAVDKEDFTLVIINFLPEAYSEYRIGVPHGGFYKEIMNTDGIEYGGSGWTNDDVIKTEKNPCHGKNFSLIVKIPPLAGVILKFIPEYN